MSNALLIVGILGLIFAGVKFKAEALPSSIKTESEYWTTIAILRYVQITNEGVNHAAIGLVIAAAVARYIGW